MYQTYSNVNVLRIGGLALFFLILIFFVIAVVGVHSPTYNIVLSRRRNRISDRARRLGTGSNRRRWRRWTGDDDTTGKVCGGGEGIVLGTDGPFINDHRQLRLAEEGSSKTHDQGIRRPCPGFVTIQNEQNLYICTIGEFWDHKTIKSSICEACFILAFGSGILRWVFTTG